ncbi:hypothetical protein [Phreatobacter sp.]|uniref:hypothetical protein n=1 Tax=Phreatobacter sp. TaxID=1966341 RepID=UPI003F704FAA
MRGITGVAVIAALTALPLTLLVQPGSQGRDRVEVAIRPLSDDAETRSSVPVWRVAPVRHAAFDVDAPRWRPAGLQTSLLRRSDGLSRELFQFGEATGQGRHAVLAADRGRTDPADAEQDVARLAADLAIEAEVRGGTETLETKFGPLPVVEMTIATPAGPKACLGFALRDGEAEFRAAGWICSAGQEIVSRPEARCFLDRLFAVSAGDPQVAQVFTRAELRRQPCAGASGTQAAPVRAFDNPSAARLRTNRL